MKDKLDLKAPGYDYNGLWTELQRRGSACINMFPENWQEGDVYILCEINPDGEAYPHAKIVAQSTDLDFARGLRKSFTELDTDNYYTDLGVFKTQGKKGDFLKAENLTRVE